MIKFRLYLLEDPDSVDEAPPVDPPPVDWNVVEEDGISANAYFQLL